MTHVTCKLTAKNGDQLQNPTLGNRVWDIFFYPWYMSNAWRQSTCVVCLSLNLLVLAYTIIPG